jgi:hypothetical protein
MRLKRTPSILVVSLTLACGPDAPNITGLIGTYSSRGAGVSTNDSSLVQYEIREDGAFTVVRIGSSKGEACNRIRGEPSEYTWNALGDNAIEVSFPDRATGADAWRISPGPACTMRVRPVNAGVVSAKGMEFGRGAVCLAAPTACPEGEICGGCNLIWCDEAPLPCEDGG